MAEVRFTATGLFENEPRKRRRRRGPGAALPLPALPWMALALIALPMTFCSPLAVHIKIAASVSPTQNALASVTGTIDDPQSAEVTIIHDGATLRSVPVVNGQFQVEVNLRPEKNTIEARTDVAVSDPLEVFLLPSISIDPNSPTVDGFVYVNGIVENSNRKTAKLAVRPTDGVYGSPEDVQVSNRRFSWRVPLPEQTLTVWVKAFMEFDPPYGVVQSDEVSFSGPPPVVTPTTVVISPPTDWTDKEMETVGGTIEGPQADEITLLVNGLAQPPVKVKVGTRSFTSQVSLSIGNNLIAALRFASKPVIFERKQPVVKINAPKDGDTVFVDSVPVSVGVSDSKSKRVELVVNGRNEKPAELSNGGFAFSNVNLTMGRNTIRATVPNATPAEVTILREKPPVVTITDPKDGAEISKEIISVLGKVENPRGPIKLSVNDKPDPNDHAVSNGGFTAENVKLERGKKNVIKAWTPGFEPVATISVIYAPPPPIVRIKTNKLRTTDNSVDVTGTVDNSTVEVATLTVTRRNGKQDEFKPDEVPPGKFEKKAVHLELGDNVIQAHVPGASSNSVTVTKLPSIRITDPPKQKDGKPPIHHNDLTISGEVNDADIFKVEIVVKQGNKYQKSDEVEVKDQKFSTNVGLSREQEQDTVNTITATIPGTKASDQVTVISSQYVVYFSSSTLIVTILKPTRMYSTDKSTAEIIVKVEEKDQNNALKPVSKASVTVTRIFNRPNGLQPLNENFPPKSSGDGIFTATVSLKVGRNQVKATAGAEPHMAFDEITIDYKPTSLIPTTPRNRVRK